MEVLYANNMFFLFFLLVNTYLFFVQIFHFGLSRDFMQMKDEGW